MFVCLWADVVRCHLFCRCNRNLIRKCSTATNFLLFRFLILEQGKSKKREENSIRRSKHFSYQNLSKWLFFSFSFFFERFYSFPSLFMFMFMFIRLFCSGCWLHHNVHFIRFIHLSRCKKDAIFNHTLRLYVRSKRTDPISWRKKKLFSKDKKSEKAHKIVSLAGEKWKIPLERDIPMSFRWRMQKLLIHCYLIEVYFQLSNSSFIKWVLKLHCIFEDIMLNNFVVHVLFIASCILHWYTSGLGWAAVSHCRDVKWSEIVEMENMRNFTLHFQSKRSI